MSQIKFGTDGWRGIIAEDYTFDNVRICSQGIANYHKTNKLDARPIVVGYDTRFGSRQFASAVVEVLVENEIPVVFCDRPTATPVLSYTVLAHQAAGAIIITASHNPSQWNGLKYRTENGASPSPDTLVAIEEEILKVHGSKVKPAVDFHLATQSDLVEIIDPTTRYLEGIRDAVDVENIKEAGLSVVVDVMHGAGAGYIRRVLQGGNTKTREIRSRPNPIFPGMVNPEPVAINLGSLSRSIRRANASVGIALDGDGDRLGVVDSSGRFISQLQVFALLAYYFLEIKGSRGAIIKSLTTTSMVWHFAEKYGVPVYETGVGFKYIAPLMAEHDALLGGEESGGYAFRGHIPERDGILSGLCVLDMVARTGRSIQNLIEDVYTITGSHHYGRKDISLGEEQRPEIQKRLDLLRPKTIAGHSIVAVDTFDGIKFHLERGFWIMVRLSGTEPLLRVYAEAESKADVQQLIKGLEVCLRG